ncbi:Myosin-1, partial [Thalictrum thalictroides]
KLNLKSSRDFDYLKQSGCLTIDAVDDAQKFHTLVEALDVVQISREDQENVFSMLSAVLWLGNISFQIIDSENHVEVLADEAVVSASKLMGCDVHDLMLLLSTHHIQAGNNSVAQKLKLEQAIEVRNTLAKSIYANLFDWLLEKINKSLKINQQKAWKSISILDIYGFESFQRNSFEQFCINYANERLQQHFKQHIFKFEQEEYKREGIDWTRVDFKDNQECLNLIEQKPYGLLQLLDEESKSAHATDLTLANKLKHHLSSNPCFKGKKDGFFSVFHYAGEKPYGLLQLLDEESKSAHATDLTLANKLKHHLSSNPCFKGKKDGFFSVFHYAGEVSFSTT